MEFYLQLIKFIIFIEANTVIINAVDHSTLIDYHACLDDDSYPNISTEKLYQIIVDAFSAVVAECELTMILDKSKNIIELCIDIKSYMFSETLNIKLHATKELESIQMLSNKLDYFNTKMHTRDEEIAQLRSQIDILNKFIPWLQLWSQFIPAFRTPAACSPPEHYYHPGTATATAPCSIYELTHNIYCDDLIVDNYWLYMCGSVINFDDSPKILLIDLLLLYNPISLTIKQQDNNIIKDTIKLFIETKLSAYTNLQRLHIENSNIKTISQLLQLDNLVEITLINCINILDLQALKDHMGLKKLFISSNMNSGVFADSTGFEIKVS